MSRFSSLSSSSVQPSALCLLNFTLYPILSSSFCFDSSTPSDFASYACIGRLMALFSNNPMILFLLLYRFIAFNKTRFCSSEINSLYFFGKKLFISFLIFF